ncbi:MAG: sodium:solute symporter family protein [Betaproteobacteria bacterium]
MLLWFVILYWIVSVAIGLIASLKVKNATDFAAAGHALPMYVVTATVFATWFGAEAVLGAPATFLKEGLAGVVADPFGSSMCLVLVGLFFAKPLYQAKYLTIGDFYRDRYGRTVEVIITLCIAASYLGWVSAQIMALGLVFNVVSGGEISRDVGMLIGSGSVLIYTLFGGMWAVAVTDFIQMIIIVIGLIYIGVEVTDMAGGVVHVVDHANNAGLFNFFPKANFAEIIGFISALCTMMLGSIPQQDVFQRVTSSKTVQIAQRAAILGGVLYFCFAFIPMILAYSANLLDPEMVKAGLSEDSQLILPQLILNNTPLFAQVIFFGALLSAIKSCASATLLAPSVSFSENIIKGFFKELTPAQYLLIMRVTTLVFTVLVTIIALNSQLSIFKMVESAYKVTLVTAFVPLLCGVYWKRATPIGGLLAVVFGLVSWLLMEAILPKEMIPPQMVGLLFSFLGMFVGSVLIPSEIIKESNETSQSIF